MITKNLGPIVGAYFISNYSNNLHFTYYFVQFSMQLTNIIDSSQTLNGRRFPIFWNEWSIYRFAFRRRANKTDLLPISRINFSNSGISWEQGKDDKCGYLLRFGERIKFIEGAMTDVDLWMELKDFFEL